MANKETSPYSDWDAIEVQDFLNSLRKASTVAIDTETTGLKVTTVDHAIGLSVAFLDESRKIQAMYFPYGHVDSVNNIPAWLKRELKEIIEDIPTTVFHHAKFDIPSLETLGINITGRFICTLVLSHLVNENKPWNGKGLDALAKHYLGPNRGKLKMPGFDEYVASIGWGNVPYFLMKDYATHDAVLTLELAYKLWPLYKAECEDKLKGETSVWDRKQKLIRVLIQMNKWGVAVDTKRCEELIAQGEVAMEEAQKALGGVNPSSPLQLKELLIDRLGLPVLAWTKPAKGKDPAQHVPKPSFTKAVMPDYERLLEEIGDSSDIAANIIKFRGWQKSVSAFYRAWLNHLSPDGRLRPNYVMHKDPDDGGTVTGRLCVSPDTLIDMPRDMTVYPDGIPMYLVKPGDLVYSFDRHMNLTLRKVNWVGKTKTAATVIVTFRNSEGEERHLQCTPDHLVRLYDGSWMYADYLDRGIRSDSLGRRALAMVRRGSHGGYITFFPNSNARQETRRNGSTAGGRNLEHRWIMAQVLGKKLSTKFEVNHIDGNKMNNHPSNLEYLPSSEHREQSWEDGTRGTSQPGSDVYMGPTDFRIVSVEPGPVIDVWDMEVDVDHQFIANGIVVHNSCREPNLQQIPRITKQPWNKDVKKCLIPAPGYVLVEADYSQLELRLGTAYAKELSLAQVFEEGRDIFTEMSERLNMTRDATKTFVYSTQYGAGINRISSVFKITKSQAEALRQHYYRTYPGFRALSDKASTVAKTVGKVRLWSGRYRHFLKPQEEAHKAMNSLIQGGAADIVESVMIECFEEFVNEDCRLLLQVHDSLVFEIKEDQLQHYAKLIRSTMEGVNEHTHKFGVKFAVDVHYLGGDAVEIKNEAQEV